MQFEELQPEVSIALDTCRELINSKRFETVLHYVLSIGNYVNGGTPKGGCHGFMLKSLPKLADARGMKLIARCRACAHSLHPLGKDKDTTLMSFLIHSLRSSRDSDAADFAKDIPTVLKAAESSVKVDKRR